MTRDAGGCGNDACCRRLTHNRRKQADVVCVETRRCSSSAVWAWDGSEKAGTGVRCCRNDWERGTRSEQKQRLTACYYRGHSGIELSSLHNRPTPAQLLLTHPSMQVEAMPLDRHTRTVFSPYHAHLPQHGWTLTHQTAIPSRNTYTFALVMLIRIPMRVGSRRPSVT